MKKLWNNKMLKTFVIIDSIWLIGILINYWIFNDFISIPYIGLFIFSNICIYIGLHDINDNINK
ncbi:MAG: hypothetical protein ACLRT4_09515 [Thomasclavelia sp.]